MNTNPAAVPAPMTKEASEQALYVNVYVPVFLKKLASCPHVPPLQTDAEVEAAIRMGNKLRLAHDNGVIKTAVAQSPFLAAEQTLDGLLNKVAAVNSGGLDAQINAEAARLAKDPTLQAAAIAWQDSYAKELMAAS